MPLARRPSRAPIAPAIVISHDDLVIMLLIELLRWLHVIGAAVLLGTGARHRLLAIFWFMLAKPAFTLF